MNRSVKLFFCACVALGIVGFAGAQEAGPAVGKPPTTQVIKPRRNFLAMAREVLGKMTLTDTQKGQVKVLYKTSTAKVKELRQEAKGSTDKEALKTERAAFVKDFRESLFKILTPEQVTQFKQIHKDLVKKEKEGESKTTIHPSLAV